MDLQQRRLPEYKVAALKEALAGFIGTEHYYRHALYRDYNFTDGVHYLAPTASSWWLVDDCIGISKYKFPNERFLTFKLSVDLEKHKAVLTVRDGNKDIHTKNYSYCDFPLDEIELWIVNKVVLLPSEY